ncbi:MAG: site-specific DNA-methyltransferase [Pseudonocardiales bacterium]|nr:site-specific DNA-methyltransferase [Pseudonocardiales bacterium]
MTESARRRPAGVATTDVTLSAHVATNAAVFAQLMALHVPLGSRVADVTWGKGAFWRQVPAEHYQILATDLQAGVDCRDLPYPDGELDAVVLDPPYMEGLFRRDTTQLAGSGSHAAFRGRYSSGEATASDAGTPRWHDAVLELYLQAGIEARRVLRNHGVCIVKCQDEVSANRQRLTHVELINAFASDGFYCKDLFVVVRPNRPVVARLLRQEHARKNHSYFLVFVKLDPEHPKRLRAPKTR